MHEYEVYKTTCNVNGKYYYGVAKSNRTRKGKYFGSGKLIKHAVNKYGVENFTKRVLFTGTMEECFELEAFILTPATLGDSNNYNLGVGGRGGAQHTNPHSDEAKLRMRESHWSKHGGVPWNKGLKGVDNNQRGLKRSEETRQKLRDAWVKRKEKYGRQK